MGDLYKDLGQHLQGSFPGEYIVEIGSDRGEGSSAYFAELAHKHDLGFVTVDIDSHAEYRLRKTIPQDLFNRVEVVQADGVEWAQAFRGQRKKIRVLYLDNFDWDWNVNEPNPMIQEQQQWYKQRGREFTNLNSQICHLEQMLNLLPCMSDRCVVCLDDTYLYNGVYIGKGGPIVPYLLIHGFGLLQVSTCGVTLGRGYQNYIL